MVLTLQHHQHFPGIPSASGLAFYNGHYYIVGDDATKLFILNADLTLNNRLPVPGAESNGEQPRIPKKIKKDWESLSIIKAANKTALMALGSGSLAPHRNAALLYFPDTGAMEIKDLTAFYETLKLEADLNIEAATELGEALLLGNRGHLGKPENLLILSAVQEIWKPVSGTHICHLHLPEEPGFSGISGLAWHPEKDWLFFTTSKEETTNVYDDGKISDSRMGIIKNATAAVKQSTVRPDEWFKLEEVHPVFNSQKIESICVRELADTMEIMLVADNDDGGSHIFRLAAG
ncbi:DUF6929 family protein [Chitinophaga lutea]|nr:hypothetical protein [Chitinophaga lutea]